MKLILLILTLSYGVCFSQIDNDSLKKTDLNSTYHANTLSVHPFGMFISRINNNFQLKAEKKMSITANISSGNVWLPYVKAYNPLNEDDRIAMQNIVWHRRYAFYDENSSPTETIENQADGIIRHYQIKFNIPISDNQEISLSSRMFSLDEGNIPYSLLTSDQFLEWFHSNIAGGEDPFARKAYGFNQAKIRYMDENGKTLQIDKGDFIFSGIDLSYYYYPHFNFLEKMNIYVNVGLQMGANVSKVNPSLDFGLNSSFVKRLALNNKKELHFGLSIGALRQRLLCFGDAVKLSDKKFLLSSEILFEYVKQINQRSSFSIASTYYVQSSYNKKGGFEYLVLTGDRISTHWHYAISHLYRFLSAHTLTLTYANGDIAYWMYLREDLLVDNAPDAQVGIGLKVYFR